MKSSYKFLIFLLITENKSGALIRAWLQDQGVYFHPLVKSKARQKKKPPLALGDGSLYEKESSFSCLGSDFSIASSQVRQFSTVRRKLQCLRSAWRSPCRGHHFILILPIPQTAVFNNSRAGKAIALQFLTLIFSLKIKMNKKATALCFSKRQGIRRPRSQEFTLLLPPFFPFPPLFPVP